MVNNLKMFDKILKPKSCSIKFYLTHVDEIGTSIPHPARSSHFLPEWYKKIEKGRGGIDSTLSIKACMPVKDLMTSGYILPHWQDAHIKYDQETHQITFSTPLDMLGMETHENHQVAGCPNNRAAVIKFKTPWIIQTPPGYSCLFIQPQFQPVSNDISMISSIVDTDKYFHNMTFPFFYHPYNQETRIKSGDPMIQIIPFKRESWISKIVTNMSKKEKNKELDTSIVINKSYENRYSKNFWCPKSYK